MAELVVADAKQTPDNVFTAQVLTFLGCTAGDTFFIAYGSDFYPFATMPSPASSAGTPVLVEGVSLGDGIGHIKTFLCPVGTSGDHTVTIPPHTDCDIHGIALRFPQAVTAAGFAALFDPANTTDFHTAPGVNTTGADQLLVCVWLTPSGPAWTGEPYQPQSPMVERGETAASPFSAMLVATENIPASGATGTRTAQWIAARKYAAISVALAGAGGAPDITGDLAAVLPALTTSATADVTVVGTIDAQLPPIQAAASATVEVDGTIAATLPALQASATGDVTVTGALAADLPPLAANLTATVDVAGQMAATLPPLAAALTGVVDVEATLAATLPALTASLTGDVAATPEGVLAATLPAITATLTGTSDAIALPEVTVTVGPARLGWPVGPAWLGWPVGPAELGGE